MNDADAQAIASYRTGHFRTSAGARLDLMGLAAVTVYSGYALLEEVGPRGTRGIKLIWPGDLLTTPGSVPDATARQVRALTDVTYCGFGMADWTALLEEPSLAARVVRILSRELHESDALKAAMLELSAPGRTCRVLGDAYLQLSRRKLTRSAEFDLPLTREELAQLVGLTTTHLRRTLNHLSEQNILSFRRGRVEMYELTQVFALAGLSGAASADGILL